MVEKDEYTPDHPEIRWKIAIQKILDEVGRDTPYSDAAEIYDKLLKAHKEIYGDEGHDYHWGGIMGKGMGVSRAQLDTYLLIRIFGMMKCLMERGTELKDDFYLGDIPPESTPKEWEAKEDFKEIKISELPEDMLKKIYSKDYITKAYVNSEGTYRIQVVNEPLADKGGPKGSKISYLMDYNPKAKNGFCMHDSKIEIPRK